jgi:hypothetical protein
LIPKNKIDYDPNDLLTTDPNLPTHWTSGEQNVKNVNWNVQDSTSNSQMFGPVKIDSVTRKWVGIEGSVYVSETITHHAFATFALFDFAFNKPEIRLKYKWPNFYPICSIRSDCYPSNWINGTLFTNNRVVVCAMGNTNDCQNWFYRSRFGQYIVEINYFAPNRGMDENGFNNLINNFENDFEFHFLTR